MWPWRPPLQGPVHHCLNLLSDAHAKEGASVSQKHTGEFLAETCFLFTHIMDVNTCLLPAAELGSLFILS